MTSRPCRHLTIAPVVCAVKVLVAWSVAETLRAFGLPVVVFVALVWVVSEWPVIGGMP